jgi:hypothetical protein
MTKTNNYLTMLAILVTLAALTAVGTVAAAGNAEAVTKARTTLTIKAEGVDLSGKVKNQRLSCLGGRTVKVYKQKGTEQSPSTDPVVASDISERVGDVGVWSTGNTGLEGKFYARTRGTLACTGATSETIVARR